MMNICTKYGFDVIIISGSYVDTDNTRRTTDDDRRTTDARQRHGYKLPTGELYNKHDKNNNNNNNNSKKNNGGGGGGGASGCSSSNSSSCLTLPDINPRSF